jgi:hypothetical protein
VNDIRVISVARGWVRAPMNEYEMPLIAERRGETVEFEAVGRGVMPGPDARPPAQMWAAR